MREEGQCPYCGNEDTEVVDTDLDINPISGNFEIKREYLCDKCHKTFTELFIAEHCGCLDEDGNEIKQYIL